MNNDFKPLQDYLKTVYRQLHIDDAVDGVEVVAAYRQVVGDLINKLTTSVRYDHHRLYVNLASAALRTELSYKRQSLTDKINTTMGRNVLQEIIFR